MTDQQPQQTQTLPQRCCQCSQSSEWLGYWCQEHWEAHCAQAWDEMIQALDQLPDQEKQ